MKRAKRNRSSDATQSPQHVKKIIKASPGESASKIRHKPSSSSAEDSDIDGDPSKDIMTFQKTCHTIQTLFEQMKVLKDKNVGAEESEIDELRIQCLLSFMVLKRCNRSAQLLNKKAKDKTQEAKQEVDGLHLQLQNLLYEIMHLKKEINKCLQFKSKDQELDLISEEQFVNEKSENADIDVTDSHKLMLARLDWELTERQSLTTKKQDYVDTKKKLAQEIKSKNEFLKSLKPGLNAVLEATLPIQENMEITLNAQRLQYQTAKYLPRPLYVLFVQSTAYHEACDSEIKISIIGEVEAAKAAIEDKPGVVDTFSEKNEEEEPEELPKKRHHRRATDEVRQEERRKASLKKHPLQVQLEIVCKDEANLVLLFGYIQALNIVTVTVQVNLLRESSPPVFSGRSLLCPNSILTCLFPEDYGNTTPNPANHYLLTSLGVKDFASHILNIGHPYQWVQKISGLNFPSDTSSTETITVESSVSASNMERTVKAIKARILTRVSLQSQLSSLESLIIQEHNDSATLFPVKSLSKLESWTPLTLSDFLDLPFVDKSPELETITENDMLFVATFTKDKVKLHAAVIVLCDYPIRPPLFTLAVSTNGSYLKDDYIRALETEVNVFYEELFVGDSRDNVLSNQLRRLQMCFDIYNDTNNANKQDRPHHEFLILRTKRGRDRGLALKYDDSHGCFTHRCKDINFSSFLNHSFSDEKV